MIFSKIFLKKIECKTKREFFLHIDKLKEWKKSNQIAITWKHVDL